MKVCLSAVTSIYGRLGLVNKVEIEPVDGPVNFSIQPPGSKSITNRALLCAALANGESKLSGVLDSDDTRVMLEGLRQVGVELRHDRGDRSVIVPGVCGRIPNPSASIDVEGSGTTIRFLTAALAAAGGAYRLDGIERMRLRPIGELVDALNALGASVSTESGIGFPPVQIESQGMCGGSTVVGANISSQFLSGLLMAAPLAKEKVELTIDGELVSKPYVSMTIEVMKSFGVEVEILDDMKRFLIEPQQYVACDYTIEPDASAASYFWAAAAICGGRAKVVGLGRDALQGDVRFVEVLREMGCRVEYGGSYVAVEGPATNPVNVDMGDISDTVQTLAAVAMFVEGTTRVSNIAHNRVKETDRIGDLATELRKLGASVEEFEDGLTISPGELQGGEVDTYNDHRMAMSLSLIGLKQPGIVIRDPKCVAKTYPDFFDDLAVVR